MPYRGVAPAMQDVIGGHIPMVFISVSNALAAMQTGRVKILAVLEPKRYREAAGRAVDVGDHPGVPQAVVLVRLFRARRICRAPIVTRLNAEMVKALNAPDVRAKLEDNGHGGDRRHARSNSRALLKDGIERYGAIIKATGIQSE